MFDLLYTLAVPKSENTLTCLSYQQLTGSGASLQSCPQRRVSYKRQVNARCPGDQSFHTTFTGNASTCLATGFQPERVVAVLILCSDAVCSGRRWPHSFSVVAGHLQCCIIQLNILMHVINLALTLPRVAKYGACEHLIRLGSKAVTGSLEVFLCVPPNCMY